MVKIELDIKGISWYIETTLETDTVPAVGDIIIVDKDCISARDRAELWKIPSNQVFKWVDWTFGLNYGLTAGSDDRLNNAFNANLRYSF